VSVDPLNDSRAPIQSLSVPQRLKMFYEQQEAAEEREAEAARYQREAEAEAFTMQTVARQRAELYLTGHTTEELTAWRNEQRATRDAKIAELERELGRLKGLPDPDLPRMARSASLWSKQAPAAPSDPVEALLHRANNVPGAEFMRRQVEQHDARQEAARQVSRQAEIEWLEMQVKREAEADRRGYISR
jgi:hypothetical protein